jgi:hypothetical protein
MPGELVIVWPSQSPAANLASSPGIIAPELAAAILRPCGLPVIRALPQPSPLQGEAALAVAGALSLAALPHVDWDFLGLVGGAFQLVTAPIRALVDAVGSQAAAPYQFMAGVVGDVGNILNFSLMTVADVINAGISAGAAVGGAVVVTGIKAALGGAGDVIGLALGGIGSALGGAGDVVRAGLGGLGTALHVALVTAGSVVAGAIGGLGGAFAAALGALPVALAGGLALLAAPLWAMPAAMLAGLVGLGAVIIATAGPLLLQVLAWIKANVIDPLVEKGAELVNWLGHEVGGIGSGDPESALPLAIGLIAAAMPVGIAAHALAAAAEHTHPLKHIGYGTAARFLVDMTDLQLLSRATIGNAVAMCVGHPMEYWMSRRVRWRIPEPRDVLVSYTKGDLGEGDTRLAMAYHGYTEDRISYLVESAWREPRPFELRRLADSGEMPPAWLRSKLRRNQLRPEDAELIAQAIEHNMFATQRGELYGNAYALLEAGVSTPARFADDVAGLGLQPVQIQLAVKAAALGHAKDLVTYQSTTLTQQAKDGTVSVDDYGLALLALGMEPSRVRAQQARVRAYLAPKVAAKVNAAAQAEYRKLQESQTTLAIQEFRRGLSDEATLYTTLVAIGLDPDLATTTVDIEVARRTPLVPVKADTSAAQLQAQVAAEYQKAYLAEFRAGQIDEATLRANLLSLGLDPALVDALVADELARDYKPPDLTPSPEEEAATRALMNAVVGLYRDAFRAGYIDRVNYLAALVAAGMDPDLAEVTVEREELRLRVQSPGATTA